MILFLGQKYGNFLNIAVLGVLKVKNVDERLFYYEV
jgi:hypothetical protein